MLRQTSFTSNAPDLNPMCKSRVIFEKIWRFVKKYCTVIRYVTTYPKMYVIVKSYPLIHKRGIRGNSFDLCSRLCFSTVIWYLKKRIELGMYRKMNKYSRYLLLLLFIYKGYFNIGYFNIVFLQIGKSIQKAGSIGYSACKSRFLEALVWRLYNPYIISFYSCKGCVGTSS